VKNDFFLKLVDKHQIGGMQHVSCSRTLCWEEWGVDNTRFMAYGMQPRWLRLAPRFMSSQAFGFFVSPFSTRLARELPLTKHGSFLVVGMSTG
jgi:hypothetical protein